MRFAILVVLFFFIACVQESKNSSFLAQVKRLEYNRSEDLNAWKNLYQPYRSEKERIQILQAMSKTANQTFLPFYADIIQHSTSEAIKSLALFAIGQLKNDSAVNTLLTLPFDSLNMSSRRAFLLALSQSCNEQSINFFNSLQNSGLANAAFWQAVALCARQKKVPSALYQKLADSSFYKDLSVSKAYFVYYASSLKELPNLIRSIKDGNGLQQKYLLKTVARLYRLHPQRFRSMLQSDSVLSTYFVNRLSSLVSKPLDWQNKLYLLKLASLGDDSLTPQLVYQLSNDENIHVQIQAFKTLSILSDSLATEAILSRISDMDNLYLKGNCLILLAKLQPQKAYRLIAQELGKGDVYYKSLLLKALAALSNTFASQTLKQYLRVPEPYLNVTAFELLDHQHKIYKSDALQLLQSNSLFCVYTGLNWYFRHKQKLSEQILLELFRKFNKSSGFEVQKALIDAFKNQGFAPDTATMQTFVANAGHPTILKYLYRYFPEIIKKHTNQYNYLNYLPSFLSPDSIVNHSIPSDVILYTSKGTVTIELLPQEAPLTCRNFIVLAKRHFYDQLAFHRVVPDFVIQGGDPSGNGFGGPGYLIPSEDHATPFKRGSVGMATAGFDSGGSQFFICQSEQPHLTGNYTLFGRVKDGMDVVDKIVPGDKILSVTFSK